MGCSRRVLGELNGDWNARVMFVAEAPGRLGAEVTGVPLFGDRTGDRFDQLLNAMDWNRSALFVTNAVLCNPRDIDGNNDRPTTEEIQNCAPFLRRSIEVVNPALVIGLGRVALEALRRIADHQCDLKKSAGTVVSWNQRYLGVLYHPGPRTVVHRRWADQVRDAKRIAAFAQDLGISMPTTERPALFNERSTSVLTGSVLQTARELD